MGSGTLRGGKFNLLFSVRHNASNERLNQWRESFQRASELIYDATDGQHQLGDIYIVNNSHGGRNADGWLMEMDGRSNAGDLGALGTETTHMTLWGDERFRPFVLAHELIHYLYGPADEYSGPDGSAECVGSSSSSACIMEGGWWEGDRFGEDGDGGTLITGRYNELCTDENHDSDDDTWQEDIWGEDCWQTLVDESPTLIKPTGAPTEDPPGDADTINWIELVPEERFVLVLDRSGSMSGSKIREAKFGADWWAGQTLDGENLGIVSYATAASSPPDFSLSEINNDSDRAAAQSAVAGITAGGRTAIGDGLRVALDEILNAGDRASTQVIVLLTDGLHNEGEAPLSVLPDLIDNGIRVYTIGVGPSINATMLQQLADDTGGSFTRIDPSLPIEDQEFAIRTALQEISGTSRDGGGLITTFPEKVRAGAGEREAHTIVVESGSELATFSASWPNAKEQFEIRLTSPDGQEITSDTQDSNIRELGNIKSRKPWHGFHILKPTPGKWRLEVLPIETQENSEVQVSAFSRNRSIEASLDVRRINLRGDRVPIGIHTYHDVPLAQLSMEGHVITPSGSRMPIEIGDVFEHPDRCDTGRASAEFTATKQRGTYQLKVSVEANEKETRPASGGERMRKEKRGIPDIKIPQFKREYTASFRVGEEKPRSITITPDSGYPGQQLTVRIEGNLTHFMPSGTFASFGPGVRILNHKVIDTETLLVNISINDQADTRRNTVTVTTPRRNEVVELEDAFSIDRQHDKDDLYPIGRIKGLIFDTHSQLEGLRLSNSDKIIATPASSERILRKSLKDGDKVRLSLSEDGSVNKIELR